MAILVQCVAGSGQATRFKELCRAVKVTPKPEGDSLGWVDFSVDNYYEDSLAWLMTKLVENGILYACPRVFVYGTLRKGQHNHHYLNGYPYLGASMAGKLIDMGRGFPYFTLADAADASLVTGEAYDIAPEDYAKVMWKLDSLEGHPDHYERILYPAMLSNGEADLCWVYRVTADRVARGRQIASGDWVEFRHSGIVITA